MTLGISVRAVNRLLRAYREKGKAAFVHGNRSRPSANSLSKDINDLIVSLYQEKYQGFSFSHYRDLLEEREGIPVSYASIYRILTNHGFVSPKCRRATRKKLAKIKYLAAHPHAPEAEVVNAVRQEISIRDAHPRQQRCKYFGEEIQMDGSLHLWFGQRKAVLHLAIDNATRTIVGGFFDWQETLNGYYHVFHQILSNYGIPFKFKTDNRSVFYYRNCKMKDDTQDTFTQFSYACQYLGVQIETTSVCQSKGVIERANQTFQDRLKNELSLAAISSIDSANRYLTEIFIPKHNRRFADPITGFPSVFEVAPSASEINTILAVITPRKFDNGSSIRYLGSFYQTVDEDSKLVCFKKSTECLVIRAFDGQLFASVDDRVFALSVVPKAQLFSPEFDQSPPDPQAPKKRYIPPMNHPWRYPAFIAAQEKAHKALLRS